MRRIDAVYQKLNELCKNNVGITASEIANALGLTRANVSSDLNKLFDEDKVKKQGTKPVLFSPVDVKYKEEKKITFDMFAEKNPSLFSAVEQAKAAVLYPPSGMNILILGETGVGKSMFAALIHKYAVEVKRMDEKSPFLIFNCADYANNSQLLISQLFGCKKGSYTGADSDKIGLIERADGGILFLDEVHRLPPEGQEMFFTFMDKGIYRRLGETEIERKSNVLIICATTETPESSLLRTFTRRIPMVIRIPSLKERGIEERLNLISDFMKNESSRLGRKIIVSVNSMKAFLSYNCTNNIGQLKTDIQLACAKAYADFLSYKKDDIKIHTIDLPSCIREGLYMETEHRQLWNKLIGINKRYYVFDKSEDSVILEDDDKNIYEMIDMRIHELKSKGLQKEEIESEIGKDIKEYISKYMCSVNEKIDVSNLKNLVTPEIIKVVNEIIEFSEERLQRKLNKSLYYGIAIHIYNSIDRIRHNRKIVNPQINKIRIEHNKEFNVALDCIKIIERVFDVSMPIDEAGFLTMFFVYDNRDVIKRQNNVRVIVVAHGKATATSLAETANTLLGVNYAVGLNAPLDEKPQAIINKLKKYIREGAIKSDILLLVDMGSLTTFSEEIEKEFNIRAKSLPLVSTPHVIEATRKAMMGYSLDEVYKDTLNVNAILSNEPIENDIANIKKKKLAIITLCTTGEGTATSIKNFLQEKLKIDNNIFDIIPLSIIENENIYSKIEKIQNEMKIVCVISTFKLDIKVPQFDLRDILSLDKINVLQNLISMENIYIKIGDTLKNNLKNVDVEYTIENVKKFIKEIEEELNIKISTNALIGITLHMTCMLDRILGGGTIEKFEDKEKLILANEKMYKVLKKACAKLEKLFKVRISDDEICCIMVSLNSKNFI